MALAQWTGWLSGPGLAVVLAVLVGIAAVLKFLIELKEMEQHERPKNER